MDSKLSLTSQKILEKQFTKNVKGYDPDEVDEFLDLVRADYMAYDSKLAEAKNYVRRLEEELKRVQDSKQELEIDNARMKKRLSGIKPGDKLNEENMEYIQRINVLEHYIYLTGVDPTKIK
ncbi:MAG: DivIVA domain-containing protein [Bacilli bacterium]|nr:DivIVA domain-containing protein [Bacilli bacterium]